MQNFWVKMTKVMIHIFIVWENYYTKYNLLRARSQRSIAPFQAQARGEGSNSPRLFKSRERKAYRKKTTSGMEVKLMPGGNTNCNEIQNFITIMPS
jgi:hypothetical protein